MHDLYAGALEDAQVTEILLRHDAQGREIHLGTLEHRDILRQPKLFQQVLDIAFQRAAAAAAPASPHTSDTASTTTTADPQAPHAPRPPGVLGKSVSLAASKLARAAAAGASLV